MHRPTAATALALWLLISLALAGCGLAPAGVPDDDSVKASGGRSGKAAPAALPSRAAGDAAVRRFAAKGMPVYCGGRAKPWVALTFDDGPGPYTKHVLTLLNRRGVARTFFLVGRNVGPNRSALKREVSGGAAIGNHSWSHPLLPSLGAAEQDDQITGTNRAIERVSGRQTKLFRPPYGAHDAATDRIVKRLGMATILWDTDSEDALGASSKKISRLVKQGFHAGGIILLHENRGQTVRALRYTILPALERSGLTAVTVPQMLAGNPPSDAQLKRGRRGCPK